MCELGALSMENAKKISLLDEALGEAFAPIRIISLALADTHTHTRTHNGCAPYSKMPF